MLASGDYGLGALEALVCPSLHNLDLWHKNFQTSYCILLIITLSLLLEAYRRLWPAFPSLGMLQTDVGFSSVCCELFY